MLEHIGSRSFERRDRRWFRRKYVRRSDRRNSRTSNPGDERELSLRQAQPNERRAESRWVARNVALVLLGSADLLRATMLKTPPTGFAHLRVTRPWQVCPASPVRRGRRCAQLLGVGFAHLRVLGTFVKGACRRAAAAPCGSSVAGNYVWLRANS